MSDWTPPYKDIWKLFSKPPKGLEKYVESWGSLFSDMTPERMAEFWRSLWGEMELPVTVMKFDEYYYVYCDVAGCEKEDIEIYEKDDGFVVVANRKPPEAVKDGKEVMSQLTFGRVSTDVPVKIADPSAVETELKNGILMLKIPEYQGKKIKIL